MPAGASGTALTLLGETVKPIAITPANSTGFMAAAPFMRARSPNRIAPDRREFRRGDCLCRLCHSPASFFLHRQGHPLASHDEEFVLKLRIISHSAQPSALAGREMIDVVAEAAATGHGAFPGKRSYAVCLVV